MIEGNWKFGITCRSDYLAVMYTLIFNRNVMQDDRNGPE